MAGYIPAQQGETDRDHPSLGRSIPTHWPNHGGLDPAQRWQPNKRNGRVLPNLLGRVHPGPRGSRRNMWYRGATCNQTPKRKELIFEKYRRPSPKKEGVDIWEVQTAKPQKARSWYVRSTDGQTPKRKEWIFDKSTDGQTLEWKELIVIKGTKEQFQPIRKEPMRATSVGKGRNRSSNTNGPQIIITGPLRN